MYAVIEDSGTQIKVAEGDVIKVDARDLPEDAVETTFDRVMFVGGVEGAEPRTGGPRRQGARGEVQAAQGLQAKPRAPSVVRQGEDHRDQGVSAGSSSGTIRVIGRPTD